MKLSLLHEADGQDLADKILQGMRGTAGSPFGRHAMARQEDPMSPERHGYSRTDQSVKDTKGVPVQRMRTGDQKGTPTKIRHKVFFNAPDSGQAHVPGFKKHGAPLGREPMPITRREAPIGVWGKTPGVHDF